ncbi:serine hydrolase domain-containing protein [Novosphingobium aerophilum]|uniref:serine hydrolase domain-containing protein n=1 Tax=Novosphingobium aerophilum TaxID=2839843 RepID=UPI003FD14BA1
MMKYLAAGALALAGGVTMAETARVAPPVETAPVGGSRIDGGHVLTRADADAWLDGFMPYALARGDLAGAVVVVVKDGAVLTQRGFGFADIASRRPVDPARTLFRPGSVSKLYTWTAVMQQVEAGRLDLDADINRYLDFRIPPFEGKPITLRNLMTHTSGFEEAGRGQILADDAILPLETVIKRWTPHRVYAPGSTPAYSNYGAALAGYIVQRVSGMPFEDYIEQNIFRRLGMKYATFREPLPAALKPFMATGYDLASGDPKRFETVSMTPPGAASISGGEMAKFMIAHLDQGGPLLRPATAKLMHSPANEPLPGINRMMLGFYEQKINGRSAIAHAGDLQWFHSNLVLFPTERVGIFVSLNAMGKDAAAGVVRNAVVRQFADRYFPAPPAPAPRDLPTSRQDAALVAGTYATTRTPVDNWAAMIGFATQIRVGTDRDGKLSVPAFKSIGGAPRHWIEVAPFVWQAAEDGERFAARVENGKVTRVFYEPVAPFMVWDLVPWYRDSAWLLPLSGAALAIILLTALAWPIGAIARKRHGAKQTLAGRDLIACRAVAIGAWLVPLLLGSWGFVIARVTKLVTPGALILFNQIVGAPLFLGFAALTAWNLLLVWKGKRGWFPKTWSVLLLLSALTILWLAVAIHLISFGADW